MKVPVRRKDVILDVVALAERAVVAALDADEGHAIVARGFRNRHDGGVHARRISAGSQNTNTTHKRIRLLIKWMEKRAHARKSARHASETRWQNPNLALLYAVWRDKVKTGENRKRAVKKNEQKLN